MSTRLKRPVRVSQLAKGLRRSFEGEDFDLEAVAPLSAPREGALTFMTRPAALSFPAKVAVLAAERSSSTAWIPTERARLDFVKALRWLDEHAGFERFVGDPQIHPTARVAPGSTLGRGVVVGADTVIGYNVRIADGVRIGSHCYIKSGAVIGEDGFGFERDADGTPLRMLHLGGVILGDRVEIGSLTTVCQGTLAPTILEDDVKVDDHVHIAHNCWIKKKTLVTACSELSGGVTVGEQSLIGPNTSVLENVHIADRVLVGVGAVVLRNVLPGATVVGNPARLLDRKSA
jgi:UDP-3-O-[3-hydroxymyristoyl] glucosamine N-acyltransferase